MSSPRVHRARPVLDGFTLLEAPRWHDGALWASDFFSRRVLRFTVDGGTAARVETVCEVPGRPSGLGFMPDGALRISSMDDCRLLEWSGSALHEVAAFGDLVSGPANDLAIDSSGTAIIGNFGVSAEAPLMASPTRLVRVDAGGTVTVAAEDVIFPNGIVIDETAGTLFVAETYRHRITAFDYLEGELANRRVWHEFEPDPHPNDDGPYDILALTAAGNTIVDGLARDAEGAIWAANASGAAQRVLDGRIVDVVDTDGLCTYSLALGGADGRDLYVCCAPPVETWDPRTSARSVLYHARVDVPAPPA